MSKFKVLSQHLPEGAKENHENLQLLGRSPKFYRLSALIQHDTRVNVPSAIDLYRPNDRRLLAK
jgi:hypothetical protein